MTSTPDASVANTAVDAAGQAAIPAGHGDEATYAPVDAHVFQHDRAFEGLSFRVEPTGPNKATKDLGITMKWTGMFLGENGKPIAGTAFIVQRIDREWVACFIDKRQDLPSQNVRLYTPGAARE